MKTNTQPPDKAGGKETVFRILICVVAVLALITAFTYMIFEIMRDSNATHRLLLHAFMAEETDPPTSLSIPSTSAAVITTEAAAVIEPTPVKQFVSLDLSAGGKLIENNTSYRLDESALLSEVIDKHLFDTRPMILIYHSDNTAAYRPPNAEGMPADTSFRDPDPQKNCIAVGNALSESLLSAGIASLHVTEAVSDVKTMIATYKKIYPSLSYAIDIRRDSLYDEAGNIVASDGYIGKDKAAQLMLAVGCDNGHTPWQNNLSGAAKVSSMLKSAATSLMRPILLESGTFGQTDSLMHLVLYVGTSGNTLEEAITSSRFFGRYFALFVLSNCGV